MSANTTRSPISLVAKLVIGVLLGCLTTLGGSRAAAVEQQIAAGFEFTVTLAPDGTVWTWGNNASGQLGNGTNTNSSVPVQVSGLTNVIAVGAGFYHALALKADGTVWGWGRNSSGQLGQGGTDTVNRNVPVQVVSLSGVGSIACGGYSSYAITRPSSQLFAWGYNNNGQVGNGTSGPNVFSPVFILSGVRKVVGGGLHALALRMDGTLSGWGFNSSGQVGDNTTIQKVSPVAVTGVTDKFIDVAAGCFHSIALRTNGLVYTWGDDSKGQLGNGATGSVSQPTPNGNSAWRVSAGYEHSLIYWFYGQTWFAGDLASGQGLASPSTVSTTFQPIGSHYTRPQAVVSGQGRHVALVKSNGSILTWGTNADGQLGNGVTNSGTTATEQTVNLRWTLDRFIQVVAGDQHSAALRADGTVWTWGSDGTGQLGNDAASASSSVPVQVTSLSDVIDLAAGSNHTLALNSSGVVSAWGYDLYGQLGDNDVTNTNKFVPVTVASQPFGVRTIGAGGIHSYLVAYDGCRVYGFGYNGNGALALGNYTSVIRVPTISGFSEVLEIDGGWVNTVALLVTGQMRTSGFGTYGQLGINSSATSNTVQTPWQSSASALPPMDNILSVNAGAYHVTSNRTSGATRSWGYNDSGQVGNGVALSPSPGSVLAPVGTGLSGKMVSAGPQGNFSLILLAGGTVTAVGDDTYGQLGNGLPQTSSSTWGTVSGLSNICSVAAGTYHGLALGADGTLYAWGYNTSGVLGTGTSGDFQTVPITVTSDTWKPQVSVTAFDSAGSEAAANTLTFRLARSFSNAGAVTVNYARSGSAANGTDYSALSGTATIPSGQSFVDVVVTPIDDPDDEDTESVDVTLSGGSQYRIGSPSGASGTITDNDTSGFVISSISANTQELDAASTTPRTFTVRLATRPSGTVVLNFASSTLAEGLVDTNSAVGNQGATTLSFNAFDWNNNKTVQVFGQNDDFDDGDIGYFISIVIDPVATLDSRYDPLDPPDVGITNIDNDIAGVVVSLISGAVTEAGGTATFSVTLSSQPYNPVNFTLSSSDTTEGVLQAGSSAVTINPINWSTGAIITVQGVNDDVDDDNQNFKIEIAKSTSSDPAYNNLGGWEAQVTCNDDDTKGVTLSGTSVGPIVEGAATTYTLNLNSRPIGASSVVLNFSGGAQLTVDADNVTPGIQTSLTIPAAEWATVRTVTITAIDDPDIEGAHVGAVTTTVQAGSGDYSSSVTIANVNCSITDNDTAGFTVSPTTSNSNRQITTEAGGTATFAVRLKTRPAAGQVVAVRLNSNDLTEGLVGATPISFSSVTTTGSTNRINVADAVDLSQLAIGLRLTILGAGANTGVQTTISAFSNSSPKFIDVTADVVDAGVETLRVFLASPATFTLVSSGADNGTSTFVFADGTNLANVVVGTSIAIESVTANATLLAAVTAVDNIVPGKSITINPYIGSPAVVTTASPETLRFALPMTLTFGNADWNVDQAVTVTGVNDAVNDSDQNYGITFNIAPAPGTTDASYAPVTQINQLMKNLDDDIPGVAIVQALGTTTVTEADVTVTGQDTFSVRLNTDPGTFAVVTLATNGQVTLDRTTLVFTPTGANIYSTPQVVTVTAVNDAVDEADIHDGTITFSISGYGAITTADPVICQVTDNDTAGIFVVPTLGLVTTENLLATNFAISLSSQPTANVTINLSSSTVAEGTVSPASVTFTSTNWYLSQSATVTGVNDDVDDGDQSYSIITGAALSVDASYSGVNPPNVVVVNVDNDTAGVTVTQTGGSTTVTEGGATDTFTVVLNSRPASGSVVVALSPGSQLTLSAPTLTFTTGNWNSAQSVTVTAVNDNVAEGAHSTSLGFSASGPAYTGLSIPSLTVSITDNDTAGTAVPLAAVTTTEAGGTGTFTFNLNTQPTANVTVVLASNDTTEGTVSPSSLTFTPGNFSELQTVTVTGVNDDVDDGDIGYGITFALVSADPAYNNLPVTSKAISNTDNDTAGFIISTISNALAENGTSGRFTVRLTSEPTATVTIGVAVSDATEASVSVSSLSFDSSSWNDPQEVTVTGVDDSINDGDIASTVVLSADVTTADTAYLIPDPTDVAVSTQDDDQAGVATSVPAISTSEDGIIVTFFTVQLLSQPNGDVTIPIASSDTTEVTVSPASLTFNASNWNSPQIITVTPVDDFAVDGTVAYTITLGTITGSSDTTGYAGLNPADVTGDHADDDEAAFVLSATTATTSEGATATNITMVLTSQPTANVIITVNGLDATEGAVSATTVTFTPSTGVAGGWNQVQTLTITGVNDDYDDGDQSYTLTLSPGGSDVTYAALATQTISVTNTDNDAAAVVITESAGTTEVAETGATDTYTIRLASRPLASATVTVTPDSQVRVNGQGTPLVLTFDPSQTSPAPNGWNTVRTITVSAVIDTFDETNPHSANITHTVASYVDQTSAAIAASPVSVTVNDNDPPQATVTSLTVPRADAANITSGMISATDDDTVAANLVFTVILAPGQGDLWLDYSDPMIRDQLINGDIFTQAAITTNRLSYRNSGTPNVSDGFAFRVSDAVGNQGDLTIFNISITGFIPPSITLTGTYSPSYTENDLPVAVDTVPTVIDPDSVSYKALTITLSGTGVSTDDEVFFATTGLITASSNTILYSGTPIGTYAGGVGTTALIVSFTGTLAGDAALTELLKALRYRNTSEDPVAGTRTVSIELMDEDDTVNVAVTKDLPVLAINDAPTISAATVITPKNIAITSALTVGDVDNYPLDLAVTTLPSKGTLSGVLIVGSTTTLVNASTSRSFTYTPNAGQEGADSFVVRVTDPDGAQTSATITVLIIGGAASRPWIVSDAPIEAEADSTLSYNIVVDFSELTPPPTAGQVSYSLVGSLPTGVTLSGFTPSGTNATLGLVIGSGAVGVIDVGVVVTETQNNTSGYQPLTIVIVPPGSLVN